MKRYVVKIYLTDGVVLTAKKFTLSNAFEAMQNAIDNLLETKYQAILFDRKTGEVFWEEEKEYGYY